MTVTYSTPAMAEHYLDTLVALSDAVGPLGDLHELQLIDHGFLALHAVADYHGRELELEKADALGLAVGQHLVVVIAEQGDLARTGVVAGAEAPGLVALAVDGLLIQLIVVADFLNLDVQARELEVHIGPVVDLTVDFHAALPPFYSLTLVLDPVRVPV